MSLYDSALFLMGCALIISWFYVYSYYRQARMSSAIASALLEDRVEIIMGDLKDITGEDNEDV